MAAKSGRGSTYMILEFRFWILDLKEFAAIAP
jgi:hypothetical protein